MANAKKCDRCGKFYEKNETKRKINGEYVEGIKICTYANRKIYDLCGDCIENLYEFMNLNDE